MDKKSDLNYEGHKCEIKKSHFIFVFLILCQKQIFHTTIWHK